MVIATRMVAGGLIEQRICPSCKHAFWTQAIAPKSECADCDPPCEPEANRGVGRAMLKHRSDSQYHGGNYAA